MNYHHRIVCIGWHYMSLKWLYVFSLNLYLNCNTSILQFLSWPCCYFSNLIHLFFLFWLINLNDNNYDILTGGESNSIKWYREAEIVHSRVAMVNSLYYVIRSSFVLFLFLFFCIELFCYLELRLSSMHLNKSWFFFDDIDVDLLNCYNYLIICYLFYQLNPFPYTPLNVFKPNSYLT